jgi:hypothetical protein
MSALYSCPEPLSCLTLFTSFSNHKGALVKHLKPVLFCICLLTHQVFPYSPTQNPGQSASKKEVLTNASVIELVKLDLSDTIIIEKIRQSGRNFDTTVGGLKQLKTANVSDSIIREIINPQGSSEVLPGSAPLAPSAESSSDPMATHEPGIYVQTRNALSEINPTTFSSTKTNFLGTALTYGIKKTKMRASIRGSSANTVVSSSRPVFYFYFGNSPGASSMAMSGFLAFGATSPAEFVLVKMDRKSNSREAVLMEIGVFGATTGTRDKDIVEFTFDKLKPGVFKVIPKNNLEIGEYCFYYSGTLAGYGLAGGKLFDFSVTIPAI